MQAPGLAHVAKAAEGPHDAHLTPPIGNAHPATLRLITSPYRHEIGLTQTRQGRKLARCAWTSVTLQCTVWDGASIQESLT